MRTDEEIPLTEQEQMIWNMITEIDRRIEALCLQNGKRMAGRDSPEWPMNASTERALTNTRATVFVLGRIRDALVEIGPAKEIPAVIALVDHLASSDVRDALLEGSVQTDQCRMNTRAIARAWMDEWYHGGFAGPHFRARVLELDA